MTVEEKIQKLKKELKLLERQRDTIDVTAAKLEEMSKGIRDGSIELVSFTEKNSTKIPVFAGEYGCTVPELKIVYRRIK